MSASMTSKFLSTNILFLDLFFFVNFLIFFLQTRFQLFPFLPLHPLKFSFFPWCSKRQISKPPYPPPQRKDKQSFQTKGNCTNQKGEIKLTLSPPLPCLEDFFFLLSKSPNKEAPLRGAGGLGILYPFNIFFEYSIFPLLCGLVSLKFALNISTFNIPYPYNSFLRYPVSL